MTQPKIPFEVIGRILHDADFRQRLLADPQATASAEGLTLSSEAISAIGQLDDSRIASAVAAAKEAGGPSSAE
jgi:hypothetical protein